MPDFPAPTPVAQRLRPRSTASSRGITATWWYTASAVLFFELALTFVTVTSVFAAGATSGEAIVAAGACFVWIAATVVLLLQYRHRSDSTRVLIARSSAAWVGVAVAVGIVVGVITQSVVVGLMPLAQVVVLLNWPAGIRVRVVAAVTAVLVVAWIVDDRMLDGRTAAIGAAQVWALLGAYIVLLPAMTVLSLWWWDVLIALDRARISESRLAATQERLRLATDVHDLQGHHLQVIALQLELAERLMPRDPESGMQQLALARRSVDEARQGTRDLATRFRSVPLRVELGNANDLLRAAGVDAYTEVSTDIDEAPTDVLGPVIRETTTNILRHGGGRRAQLSLVRARDSWCFQATNDSAGADEDATGAGLDGIRRRVADVGGTVEISRGDEFALTVRVPAVTA